MEILVASAIGCMTAAGVYLILRRRSFAVVLGMTMLSYAINLFLFVTGRLVVDRPPILHEGAAGYTDPIPQALVLTAIVISFGMTAVVVMMALGAFIEGGDDRIDLPRRDLDGRDDGAATRRRPHGRATAGRSRPAAEPSPDTSAPGREGRP